ncbi:ATP-grasp domain-containing protein [Curtobacterium sp. PhB136]|uniref:ATP-grasp domain-containing protein n=1 Tax=Curtobacterium sp. PhB136 TaxID=2485181 RepID=UPI00140531F7|nr:ATP-grasp domain-containing protein [Curtobacterium sp. PhB136]
MADGYLRAVERWGWRVLLAETPARIDALRRQYPNIVDSEAVTSPAGQDESWLAPALRLADRHRPAAVLGFAEPQVMASTLLQEALGVPGPGLFAATVSRNKALQRALFEEASIGQPAYRMAEDLSDVGDWALRNLPVVVKPTSGMGSAGVELVATEEAWAEVQASRSGHGPLLIETYVEGPEYSAEALVRNGEVVFANLTTKRTTGAPQFVELGHHVGVGTASRQEVEAATALVEDVVGAIHMVTGLVHLEFRRSHDRSFVMEVAVRTPGDHILELIGHAWGFDVYDGYLRLLSGVPFEMLVDHAAAAAAITYVNADSCGVVDTIDERRWEHIPGFLRGFVMAEAGEHVQPAEASSDRLGYAIFAAGSEDGLTRSIERADAEVVVKIAPCP